MDAIPEPESKPKRMPGWLRWMLIIVPCLVVLSIPVVLLLGAAIYKMKGSLAVVKVGRAQADISSFSTAIISYEALAGALPSTSQGLRALVERPSADPEPRAWTQIMSALQKDPWNNNYYYEQPGKHNPTSYDLYSAGPDKSPGTADDVGNWEQ